MYGQIIRNLRKEKKLTQKELAAKLGFSSSSALAMIEREERNLNVETINKLTKIFDVSADYILGKTSERYPGEIDKLEDEFKIFFNKMKNISPSDREKILKMIEIFEKESNE